MTENKKYKKHVNIFLTQYVLKTHLLEKGNKNYMKLAFNEKVHIFFQMDETRQNKVQVMLIF